jgi:hypothetical protein
MAFWLSRIAIATVCVTVQAAEPSRPVQQQIREFEILVDGARVGTSRLEIADHPDNQKVVTTDTLITIKVLFFTYVHRYQGSESWQAGQPRKLEGLTHAGRNRRLVRAAMEAARMEVSVNDMPLPAGPTVHLTTSYWHWPADLEKLKTILLLDVDNGETIKAECERVGEESLTVGTRTIKCTHYRLKGEAETDLWFDEDRQLVLRKSVEEGHRTETRLQSITLTKPAESTADAKATTPKL